VSTASRDGASADDDATLSSGWSYARKRQLFLIAMAAPALIYVLAVAVGPMVQGFLYSFDNYSLIHPGSRHFVGLDNYLSLWRAAH
jgi:multiple sugar transport system permease protein